MMKKEYKKPLITKNCETKQMAAPLAFFSAATAGAAVVGAAVGAVAASKAMGIRPDERMSTSLSSIEGIVSAA